MKYSVRGEIPISDGAIILATIATYELWRLKTQEEGGVFTFETWVNTGEDKTNLFTDLKPFVDSFGGWIDWHLCTHDEAVSSPCVIAEVYGGG